MDIYSYREGVYGPSTGDLTGFDVEATDGHIGKVDGATYDTAASTLVVDTGFWIFGKKRMIPAGVVQRVDANDEKIYVSMTKDQIKDAPDYDPDRVNDTAFRGDVGSYYEPYRGN